LIFNPGNKHTLMSISKLIILIFSKMKSVIFKVTPLVILLIQCHTDPSNKIDLAYTPDIVELFAKGVVSTKLYERDMAISPGGNEIIFTLSDYRQTKRCLVIIKKTGDTWGPKEILSISGQYADIEPCFSTDGNKLYFASDRPIDPNSERNDFNIWVSTRAKDGWSGPKPLPANINTENDEFYPSITKNNNLYFTSARENGIGKEDIFLARYDSGMYLDPVPLDTAVNSPTYEFNAYINPGENLIIFSSYGRKDDFGGGDLYYSRKDKNGNWTLSKNMGPAINSGKLDYCPFIDIPRNNFYFTSERRLTIDKKINDISELENLADDILNGMGNIYRIDLGKI
jgi:hypothetical protein